MKSDLALSYQEQYFCFLSPLLHKNWIFIHLVRISLLCPGYFFTSTKEIRCGKLDIVCSATRTS